ncbi:MAG TPA: NADH:flavin oxidoreductase/NADH oxidase [Bryobacteraceae bacterium]|nr:NADH:flavin oxidoreductase/NADH oxidase [Bryobacteraceae bacterium]
MSTVTAASHTDAAQPEGAEAHLFFPIQIRDVRLGNRIVVSPMCQYSSEEGYATDWHLVHLGSRAIGGAGLIFTEAAAVEARGRISPYDLGIWKHEHIEPLARIVRFLKQNGSVAGIQLAHAGRKASTEVPWRGRRAVNPSEGGWEPVAPSAIAFDNASLKPAELNVSEIHQITQSFVDATRRALEAGFDVIELHGAHGYLMHEFLSPISNKRTDQYGGSFENRIRFVVETVQAVRNVQPPGMPLFLRISVTDWVDGGWNPDESVELARTVRGLGVDLIDCSSGGSSPDAAIPLRPGYQVPFSERIRNETGILTGAVGLITEPAQADEILCCGSADLVFLAREFLREPYWPIKAAHALGTASPLPVQYARAFPNQPSKQSSK